MELEIGVACSNCKGINDCNKMCVLHCGKALVDFISRVDVTQTRIGEYEKTDRNGPTDLVVCGHQLFDIDNPCWLLRGISTTIDITDKFKPVYEKSAFQIANMYCKHMKMSDEETRDITEKLKGINRNKLFILPFKPHTNCNIDIEVDSESFKKQEAQIYMIKWDTNKDTNKINCSITFELINKIYGTSKVKMDIKDYIDKFRLSQMDIQAKGKNHDKNLIKITDYGIFKPICVTDGTSSIAIDGTYMYYVINGETHIIGHWDANDKMRVSTEIKTKAYNKIMDNIEYIKHHKRYIAPYLMFESNTIKI